MGDEKDRVTKYGLLIEDESDMAKRNGGRIFTVRGGTFADMDPQQTATISVFAYYLGNTDWSLYSLHNIRLVITGDRYVPVPYDFDWSGRGLRAIREAGSAARHSDRPGSLVPGPVPNARRPGPASGQVHRAPAGHQGAVRSAAARRWVPTPRDWITFDDFYRVIGDQRQVKRELIETCVGTRDVVR